MLSALRRDLFIWCLVLFSILWSAGQQRALRVMGGALVVYGLVSLIWPQFFPEDLTKSVSALTNTMHIIITVVTVLSWMLILGFGTTVFGKQFRRYSIATLLTVIIFGGVLTGWQASKTFAGPPAPWLGLMERINLYSFMLWVAVLAIALLRAPGGHSRPEDGQKLMPPETVPRLSELSHVKCVRSGKGSSALGGQPVARREPPGARARE